MSRRKISTAVTQLDFIPTAVTEPSVTVKPVTVITQSDDVEFVFKGKDEAARLMRIAQRLYEAQHTPWEKLAKEQRRPYIDEAARPAHIREMQ